MHEIFLQALYFPAPFETGRLHFLHDDGLAGQGSPGARLPGSALDKAAAGPEADAVLVKAAPGAVYIHGGAVGVRPAGREETVKSKMNSLNISAKPSSRAGWPL